MALPFALVEYSYEENNTYMNFYLIPRFIQVAKVDSKEPN